ncbi:aldehyde dehydrogenase [Aeromicrobium sp. CF4.19]|uniref:aldehyde dehydrogenase n=1 Tax=Aeromicrobium sp. CF4.19 TaxID=3373082 RepID=UPI003EE653AC
MSAADRDVAVRHFPMWIDGDLRDARSGALLESIDPFNGRVWATVPDATRDDVHEAIAAARAAFDAGWSTTLPARRATILRELGRLIEENVEILTSTQIRENGKPYSEVRPQTAGLAQFCYYFAGIAETLHGIAQPVSVPDTVAMTRREPVGVVAAVCPWNSPLALLMWKFAPAVAAANTMVVKPSESTPVSSLLFAELAEQAGLPSGVLNVVTGGPDVGRQLVESRGVDKIAFTGSTEVGRAIARTAGENLTRVSLELGGKSPNIVFDDANLGRAVDGIAAGIFSATGQSCVAGSRVLLHERIYDEVAQGLTEKARGIQVGDPLLPSTRMGTVANRTQYDKILHYIDIAHDDGATLLAGGKRAEGAELGDGLFVEPTVFGDVSMDMRIAREEVFGPVASLIRFADEHEAIRIANDTEYGLAAGIWTNDLGRAHRVSAAVRAGTVWVNTYRSTNYAVPFGGFKQSGIGRENGLEAVHEYTEVKTVWMNVADLNEA